MDLRKSLAGDLHTASLAALGAADLERAARCRPPPPTRVVLTECDEVAGIRKLRLCSKLRLPIYLLVFPFGLSSHAAPRFASALLCAWSSDLRSSDLSSRAAPHCFA